METENKRHADADGDVQGRPPTATTPLLQQQQQRGHQSHGYPEYGPAPSPYYVPPPGAGGYGGYGVAPPPQHPQQQVIVATAASAPPDMRYVYVQPTESFTGAIVYSCFVLWCCNWIFGIIAFILASE